MEYPEKLKKETKQKINDLLNFEFDKTKFIDEKVVNTLASISVESGFECAIFVDRKGKIIDIFVGEKDNVKMTKPSPTNTLNGIRVIHTHPNGNANLSDMDLSFLKNNYFDCICAIGIKNNTAYDAQIAFFDGEKITKINIENINYINKYQLMDKIFQIEKDFKQNESLSVEKAVLVCVVVNKDKNILFSFEELEGLANTCSIECVSKVIQNKDKIDARYFIGQGKLSEIKQLIQLNNANLVIFENELNASKLSNLSEQLQVKVIDRSMLILDIFAKRARTKEGKLQVELALLKYSLPRLGAINNYSNRFGGGVGMRGPGETKLETNRRVVENNILKKSAELDKLKKQREINRKGRLHNSKPMVAIVGYTNSGKSTLLNRLAKENVYVKDELFATLDTTTRNVWLKDDKQILVSDTVGFISNLPHEFIEAFSSTLEESLYADCLLNVVDISNKNYLIQQQTTLNVLNKLKCTVPIITIYNKIDKVKNLQYSNTDNEVYISASQDEGVEDLKKLLIKKLFTD